MVSVAMHSPYFLRLHFFNNRQQVCPIYMVGNVHLQIIVSMQTLPSRGEGTQNIFGSNVIVKCHRRHEVNLVLTVIQYLPLIDLVVQWATSYSIIKDRKSTRLNSSHVKSSYAVF